MGAEGSEKARAFFEDYVKPTINEFRQCPEDVRRALLAILVLDSLVDHIFVSMPNMRQNNESRAGDFRNRIGGECRAVALVRDLADTTKHLRLDRRTAAIKEFGAADKVEGSVERDYVEANYFEDGYVEAIEPDGRKHHVQRLINEAVNYLESLMDGRPWVPGPSSEISA